MARARSLNKMAQAWRYVVLAVLLLGACSKAGPLPDEPIKSVDAAAAGAQRAEVEIVIGEWFITSTSETVPSGPASLVVRNAGQYLHEVEVLRNLGGHQEYEVAEIEDIAPGETATLNLQLSPGTYELACTIVEKTASGSVYNHYLLGMSTFINVTDPLGPGASSSQEGGFRRIHPLARVIQDSRKSELNYPEIPVQDLSGFAGTQALLRDAGRLP